MDISQITADVEPPTNESNDNLQSLNSMIKFTIVNAVYNLFTMVLGIVMLMEDQDEVGWMFMTMYNIVSELQIILYGYFCYKYLITA